MVRCAKSRTYTLVAQTLNFSREITTRRLELPPTYKRRRQRPRRVKICKSWRCIWRRNSHVNIDRDVRAKICQGPTGAFRNHGRPSCVFRMEDLEPGTTMGVTVKEVPLSLVCFLAMYYFPSSSVHEISLSAVFLSIVPPQ